MPKYKIAWLPGDGVGNDVMEAAKIVLDRMSFDAEYIHGGYRLGILESGSEPAAGSNG